MKLTNRFLIGTAVIFFIALSLLLAGGTKYTSQPSFCIKCHLMKASYQNWQKDVHSRVTCLDCHAGRGWTGMVKAKLNGLKALSVHVLGENDPNKIKAKVASENCRRCHTFSEAEYKQEKNGVDPEPSRKYHESHTGRATCQECHPGTGHGKDLKQGLNISGKVCAGCHSHDSKSQLPGG